MRARGHDVCTICHTHVALDDARAHVAEHRRGGDYRLARRWGRPHPLGRLELVWSR